MWLVSARTWFVWRIYRVICWIVWIIIRRVIRSPPPVVIPIIIIGRIVIR